MKELVLWEVQIPVFVRKESDPTLHRSYPVVKVFACDADEAAQKAVERLSENHLRLLAWEYINMPRNGSPETQAALTRFVQACGAERIPHHEVLDKLADEIRAARDKS